MLVSSIVIKWRPSPVPETGSHIDWFKIKGQLLKDGNVLTELLETTLTLEVGPDATRPSEILLLEPVVEIDADTLKLELYDAEYQHSVMVNDTEFGLLDARHAEWVTYDLTLPAAPVSTIQEIGSTLITAVMVIGMMGIMKKSME